SILVVFLCSLLAFLLTCWHLPTTTQVTIELVPPQVVEGENVLLLVHSLPENLRALFWYKGVTVFKNHEVARHIISKNSSVLGPAHSGKETVYSNGSLLLQNFTRNDTGFYTLRTLTTDLKAKIVHVHLQLDKPVTQPFIRVTNTKAVVQSSVVLTCLSADTGISTRWIFNNRSLQFTKRMMLSMTKCQLRIDPVRREDAGEYQCEVSNPVSSKTSLPVRLVVMNE
ncbi:Carcinoembryonic antigen-related cell adhesion molecule 3, partial [Lemmus lemmus]